MKIAEIIYTPFKKFNFLPVLTVSSNFNKITEKILLEYRNRFCLTSEELAIDTISKLYRKHLPSVVGDVSISLE
jgi:hypothetical protein